MCRVFTLYRKALPTLSSGAQAAIPLEEKNDHFMRPRIQLCRRHGLSESQRAPLRQSYHHIDKLISGESLLVVADFCIALLSREQARNQVGRFALTAFRLYRQRQLRKAAGFT